MIEVKVVGGGRKEVKQWRMPVLFAKQNLLWKHSGCYCYLLQPILSNRRKENR